MSYSNLQKETLQNSIRTFKSVIGWSSTERFQNKNLKLEKHFF